MRTVHYLGAISYITMIRTAARMIELSPHHRMVRHPTWDPLHYMQLASAGTQIAWSHIVVGDPEETT